jgi:TonB family protein
MALSPAAGRTATLVTIAAGDWRGPEMQLRLAVTDDEARAFGRLAFLRIAGKAYTGGQFYRTPDETGQIHFVLSFSPDQIALFAGGGEFEMVERGGPGLKVALAATDPAPLLACLAAKANPLTPAQVPASLRTWTFVPLQPDQPLAIRSRGNTNLNYPSKALAEGREGISRVAVTIGLDGRIDQCAVIVSSGHPDLDAESCRTARRSSYFPATDAKGEPIETKAEQNLVWKMGD